MRSVSLPLCSSRFICAQMCDHRVCQPLPCKVASCSLLASCSLDCPAPQSAASQGPPATILPGVLSTQLCISTPPTSLDECVFFNSLVVGLPYSLFSVSSSCFLFLNCCCPSFGCARSLPMPSSWLEVLCWTFHGWS